MRYAFLIVLTMTVLTGCFDNTLQPPANTVGELVGCIEANNALYCVSEYPRAGVSLETIVQDILENSIRFEQQIVTVTGEVRVLTNSIVMETGTDRVTFVVRDASEVWDLETGKSYQMTVYIEHIDRNRFAYHVWSYPVISTLLNDPAVPVATIVADTLKDTTDYTNNAMYLTGVVKGVRDDSIQLETATADFHVFVYSEASPDLISGHTVGSEVTLPVFLAYIKKFGQNQEIHHVVFDLIKM